MTRRDRVHPDERLELRIEQRALDDLSADRIGPIEDDEGNLLLRRGLHRQDHRRDVGPGAAADFLEVVDEDVDVLQHLGRRPAILRLVERMDPDAGLRIGLVLDLLARGDRSPDAVLGRKQGGRA